MGLESQEPASDGQSLKSGPALAQTMQDEGTPEQNGSVLGLYLDNVTLAAGAPAPITQFVGSVDVAVSSVIFNPNFTRERYGKAAVSDSITLDADRRSLLLDDNQTAGQKATSIISSLEFDNGLTAVQNMSDSDVTDTVTPENIDQFSERPNSMYQNAGRLSGPKRDHLISAFTSAAEPEFVGALASQAGGDPANFTTFDDVVADQAIMQSISGDSTAIGMLSSHPNGSTQMVASQTAMDAVSAFQTARDAIGTSGIGYDKISDDPMAIGKYTAGIAGLTPSNFANIDAVASDTAAMDAVSASQKAMNAVSPSIIGRTSILSGVEVIEDIWKRDIPSDTILNQFSPAPGHSFSSSTSLEIGSNQYSSGKSLQFIVTDGPGNTRYSTELLLDFSNAETLELTTQADVDASGTERPDFFDYIVRVDGTELLDAVGSNDWESRSLDVSQFSGKLALELATQESFDDTDASVKFSEIELI